MAPVNTYELDEKDMIMNGFDPKGSSIRLSSQGLDDFPSNKVTKNDQRKSIKNESQVTLKSD